MASYGNRLTPEEVRRHWEDNRAALPNFRGEWRLFILATHIVASFLGAKWVQKEVLASTMPASTYLRPGGFKSDSEIDSIIHRDRIIALAEALLSFQHDAGFDEWLFRLSERDAEAAAQELIMGSFLLSRGFEVRPVARTTTSRGDYDFDGVAGLTTIAIEIKAKLETTIPSIASFRRSLRAAVRQLPRDRPTAVMFSLSEEWAETFRSPELPRILGEYLKPKRSVEIVYVQWTHYKQPLADRTVGRYQIRAAAAELSEAGQALLAAIDEPKAPSTRAVFLTDFLSDAEVNEILETID